MPTGGFFVYADCSRVLRRQRTILPRRARSDCGVAFTPGIDFGAPPGRAARPLRLYDRRTPKLEDGVARGSARRCLRQATSPHATSIRHRLAAAVAGARRLRRHGYAPTTTGRARRGSSTSSRARGRSTRSSARRPTPRSGERLDARAGDPRVREPRARLAGQRELHALRGRRARRSSCGTCSPRRELSLKPRQWCFPIAGCVSYRGYFNEAGARATKPRACSRRRRRIRRAACPRTRRSATSTIRCCRRSSASPTVERRAAGVPRARAPGRVREGRHAVQRVVRRGGRGGGRRALARKAARQPAARCAVRAQRERLRDEFRDLIRETRATLAALYASDVGEAEKRAQKALAFAAMRDGYERAKAGEPGLAGYDRWFAGTRTTPAPTTRASRRRAVYGGRFPRFERCWRRKTATCRCSTPASRYLAALPKAGARRSARAGRAPGRGFARAAVTATGR